MAELSNRIKEIRIKRGLSQEELAELSKVNLRTIQRIEKNETTPRASTLRLIYNVLDIEIIESEKYNINKYLVIASASTLIIFIGTFLGWYRRFEMYVGGERLYRTFTGWEGTVPLVDSVLYNWVFSLSSIILGLVVISHSAGVLRCKLKYIVVQVLILLLYINGVLIQGAIQATEIRPGLAIIVISNLLLVIMYRKNRRKQCKVSKKE